MRIISLLAEGLIGSKEELCSLELVGCVLRTSRLFEQSILVLYLQVVQLVDTLTWFRMYLTGPFQNNTGTITENE
jgi:hypothetical protein